MTRPGTTDPTTFLGISTVGQTLTQAVVSNYSSCSYTITARETAEIAGSTFYADPVTFTFTFDSNSQLLSYVYHYPSVTLDSLIPSEIITYVCISRICH